MPAKTLPNQKRYNNFGGYLKRIFGHKVYKICIDAGFTCPNRDGSKGEGGCIYCNNDSFKPQMAEAKKTVLEQLRLGIEYQKKRYQAEKFIAYFQPFSNTYAEVDILEALYNEALSHPDVVGLSIGTRPDCVSDDALSLLNDLAQKTHLWVEYGLQTMHDRTLTIINRGHTLKDFHETYQKTRMIKNIHICVHVIHGLPYESKEMMLDTIKYLAGLKIDGIKLHQLHVVKNTIMENMYLKGEIQLPSLEEYLNLIAESLELLGPEVVIQRLFGLGPLDILIAPDWNMRKAQFNNIIDQHLKKLDVWQSSQFQQQHSDQFCSF